MPQLKLSECRPLTKEMVDGYIYGLMLKLKDDNTFQIEPEQRN